MLRERMGEPRESTAAETRGTMAEESKGTGGENRSKKMKIMVAVDGSEVSMHALRWVLDHLFTSTGGSPDTSERLGTLIIVHGQPPVHIMMQPVGPAVYATSSVIESVKKAQEQNSAHVLSKAVQLCKERLVEAKTLIVDGGEPKDKICQAAEELNADLLVVGSRGLSMLKRAFLGSVSDYVVHHANCPVIVIKPNQSQPPKHGTTGGERASSA